MTPTRRAHYDEFAPRYVITTDDVADWAPDIVDIGFGSGESVVASALLHPQRRVLGVEVHEAGITRLVTDMASKDVSNVRVVRNDVLEVLPHVASASLYEICVFFPDPWPKVAHAHRRLVRNDVVAQWVDRLAPGGVLRLATDAAYYAQQMREVCDAAKTITAVSPAERVETRYERLGRSAGRTIVDLTYQRR